MRTIIFLGILALLCAVANPLRAQNVALDEGSFRVWLNGERAGTEEFSIRRVGMGSQARVILRGSVELSLDEGTLNLAPAMDARGQDLSVATYQVKTTGAESTEIYVGLNGSRYQARVISAAGEQLKEFRGGPGSVFLDRHVAHQYHLLTPYLDQDGAVSLNVLTPRDSRQVRMTLTFVGPDEVRLGDVLHPARHFRLDGGDDPRHVWFDEQGRILKVEVPSQGFMAERDEFS